jgi:nitroreductase
MNGVDPQDLLNLISTRRSIRKWTEQAVPDELIREALTAATWAPNGGNFQPWHFVVVQNQDVIHKIADAVQEKTLLMASWPEAEAYGEHIARWKQSSDFFRHAPCCIAVYMGDYRSIADRLLAERGRQDPDAAAMEDARKLGSSRLQTIAGAIMQMLLTFHAQGLGACWMAGPQQAKQEIEALLPPVEGMDFVALVPVGYPAQERELTRKPVEEVSTWIK